MQSLLTPFLFVVALVAGVANAGTLARDASFSAEGFGSGWCGPVARVRVWDSQGRTPSLSDSAFQRFVGTVRIALSIECPAAQRIDFYTAGPGEQPRVLASASRDSDWRLVGADAPTTVATGQSMLPACNARVDLESWAALRITNARLTDRPLSVSGFQGIVSSDVRAYWVLDYEVQPRVREPYKWSDDWMGSAAIDSNGNRWKTMRSGPFVGDTRVYRPDERKVGQAIFIQYAAVPAPSSLTPRLKARMTIPSKRAFGDRWADLTFQFGRIPLNCSDTRVMPQTVATASGPAQPSSQPSLVVPRQVVTKDVVTPTAAPHTVKYAVQVGFIWAFGQGVFPDYGLALAWYREAEQRQIRQRDYSMQNEIRLGISELTITDVATLLGRGQRKAAAGDWEYARLFFGRAADLGDVQGMSALAYVYDDGFKNPGMQIYWCRKAYRGARARGLLEFEIDAVNYFCPLNTFADLMTPQERKKNEVSIARARAKSEAIRREAEATSAVIRAFMSDMGGSSKLEDRVDGDIARSRDYARSVGPGAPPTPPINSFYGGCHGGPFYGC